MFQNTLAERVNLAMEYISPAHPAGGKVKATHAGKKAGMSENGRFGFHVSVGLFFAWEIAHQQRLPECAAQFVFGCGVEIELASVFAVVASWLFHGVSTIASVLILWP